jgi:GH43 family beta-xylosidase
MERRPPGRLNPTYVNPVFNRSFPDPFVLKFCGEYFAYCTGFADDGLAVGVARSTNLVEWNYIGGALRPLESEPPYYWAPEVVYSDGSFYMYYSCGNETLMEIRVAISDRPDGGFVDAGVRMTREEFAIDAHVFVDDTGDRFMFYATDFLDHSHIGTGTVVDRMQNWLELEGNPRPVSRAAYEWQVYDPNRAEKGGVRWHTVEGPTVFKHKGKYLQMFSGGNWTNSSYGVAFASSDQVLSSSEWKQSIDGETLFPVLRTIPDKVIGPGHNSAVVGPNNRELYCVYHSWVGEERVMYIDRMGLVDSRIFVKGATYTPQLAPFPPSLTLESKELEISGPWKRKGRKLVSERSPDTRLSIERKFSDLYLECWIRIIDWDEASRFSLLFGTDGSAGVEIRQDGNTFIGNGKIEELSKGRKFDPFVFHRFSLEVSPNAVEMLIDDRPAARWTRLTNTFGGLKIRADDCAAEITALSVTHGFKDVFDNPIEELALNGWRVIGDGAISFDKGQMRFSAGSGESILTRGDAFEDFDFVANLRSSSGGGFGFVLLGPDREPFQIFYIDELDDRFVVVDNNSGTHLPLPGNYSPDEYRQFRIVKIGDDLHMESEDLLLGVAKMDIGAASIGILSNGQSIELEMVRWTEIGK